MGYCTALTPIPRIPPLPRIPKLPSFADGEPKKATKKSSKKAAKKAAKKVSGSKAAHETLRGHPNFKFPVMPVDASESELVEWVIESIARFVSPPKIEGEDDEFECNDVAGAIRKMLKPELMQLVSERPFSFMGELANLDRSREKVTDDDA